MPLQLNVGGLNLMKNKIYEIYGKTINLLIGKIKNQSTR